MSDKYAAITAHRGRFPVRLMCGALDISVGGYYDSVHRAQAPARGGRAVDEQLLVEVRTAYRTSEERYGAPRVHAELRAQGMRVAKKRIARLMRADGLAARPRRRRRPVTTDSSHREPVAPNTLARRFAVTDVAGVDRVWVSDITYVPTDEGWLYLAVVLDLASRRVVGWATRDTLDRELALDALRSSAALDALRSTRCAGHSRTGVRPGGCFTIRIGGVNLSSTGRRNSVCVSGL